MDKLLKTIATPFRTVKKMISNAVTKKRSRSRSRVKVAPGDRMRNLNQHFSRVAAQKRVAKLGPRTSWGMGPKARAERRAIRNAERGYGSKRRGRKSRRGRKGRKTRRRGKRRTKSKK